MAQQVDPLDDSLAAKDMIKEFINYAVIRIREDFQASRDYDIGALTAYVLHENESQITPVKEESVIVSHLLSSYTNTGWLNFYLVSKPTFITDPIHFFHVVIDKELRGLLGLMRAPIVHQDHFIWITEEKPLLP